MISEAALLSFAVTLFSMANPIGNVGVFVGVTSDRTPQEAKRIAWACALAVLITLLVVTWAGAFVLKLFGISIDMLRTAGGIIVLLIGLNMLSNEAKHSHSPGELSDAKTQDSVAVVPLAIPIVAGPGTLAAVLVAAQQHPSVLSKLEVSVVIGIISGIVGLFFSFAKPLAMKLGAPGMGVVTRVMGMILAAIAVGMLAEGIKGLFPALAG